MAEEKKTKEEQPETEKTEEKETKQEPEKKQSAKKQTKSKANVKPKYSREELMQNAKALFDRKPEVVVGALSSSDETEFTIDEVKKKINEFTKRKA